MESIWSGASDDSFFNADVFDKNRIIQLPENEYSKKSSLDSYYILSVDVGRKSDNSVLTVIKVTPKPNAESVKRIVNIYSYEQAHFEEQSIFIKRIANLFKVKRVVVDGKGIGIGLLDYLVKSQIDEVTGEYYPSYGIYNDEEGIYKKFRKDDTVDNMVYIVRATPILNTIMHSNLQEQMISGRVKFLITEQEAKAKLMDTSKGKIMTHEQRAEYLRPYVLTSILKEELLNLTEVSDGSNIIFKQVNKKIKKDKVSSLEYGLYYIKAEEENKRKKKRFNAKDWAFFS